MGSRTIAHGFYVMDTEAFDFLYWVVTSSCSTPRYNP